MAIIKHESYIKFDKNDIHRCVIDSNYSNTWIIIQLKDNSIVRSHDTEFFTHYKNNVDSFVAFKSRIYYWLSSTKGEEFNV